MQGLTLPLTLSRDTFAGVYLYDMVLAQYRCITTANMVDDLDRHLSDLCKEFYLSIDAVKRQGREGVGEQDFPLRQI